MKQRRLTVTESKLESIKLSEFLRGKTAAEQGLRQEREALKRDQLYAINKLIEETGRIMSRAGYMLGKLNGDNSR